jgi:hypothetical protein
MDRFIDAAQDFGEDRGLTNRSDGPRSAAADHRSNDDGWISQAVYARSSAIALDAPDRLLHQWISN